MRSFPSATPVRAVAATAAATIALGVLASSSTFADDPLHHQQHRVEHHLTAARGDLEESSGALRAASASLVSARAQLSDAQASLAGARTRLLSAEQADLVLADRLASAERALTAAQEDLASGRSAVTDQRQSVVDTVTSIYEEGDPQLLAFASLLRSDDVEDLTRRTELGQIAVGHQDQVYDDLRASEVLLGVREQQVTDAKDALAARKATSAQHVSQVAALHQQAVAARDQVEALVARRRDAEQAAGAARAHDAGVLARLRTQDAKIKKQILAAAARAAAHSAAGYVGPQQGYLLPPVTGPITSPYGYRINPIYGYYGLHDGTDFGVACGTPMLASADGTVTAAYWSDVYGNRMYIDVGRINGHAITVNYNHATSYRVAVGDHVTRGEVIGYSGTTGWSTGCHLHFTILQDGVAVDPMTYLS